MRYFYTVLGFFLFLAMLGFALKNADSVTLRYYLGLEWHTPLILVLLASFCIGVIAGLMACLSLIITQRRRLLAMERELHSLQKNND